MSEEQSTEGYRAVSGRGLDSLAVDGSVRLPEFDTGGGKAYAALDEEDSQRPLYALVQNGYVPVRSELVKSLIQDPIPGLVNPIGQIVDSWQDEDGRGERLITFFERPAGPPLQMDGIIPKMGEGVIKKQILRALCQVLVTLHARDYTHRAVHPRRVYFVDGARENVVLGECVSTPPGMDQPSLFEPLESADADPMGRGEGTPLSDSFALGATIMSLFQGREVSIDKGASDPFLIRINQGSFQALSHGDEFSASVGTLLRGLLSDELVERWQPSEILQMLSGHMPVKGVTVKNYSLSRQVSFMGQNYSDRRALARAFAANTEAAVDYLQRHGLLNWIQIYLAGDVLNERQERLILSAGNDDQSSSKAVKDEQIARLCAFLDPTGPVRYRNARVCYDGVSTMLARVSFQEDRESMITFNRLLGGELMTHLLEIVGEKNFVMQRTRSSLLKYKDKIAVRSPGHGLERFFYETLRPYPCLSPLLKGNYCLNVADVLRTLDARAGSTDKEGRKIFDAHVCGFLASRASRLDNAFATLDGPFIPHGTKALPIMEAMGALQSRFYGKPLKNLAARFADAVKPVISAIRYKPRREALERKVRRLAETGDISRMSTELNLMRLQARDQQEYVAAAKMFGRLERARTRLLRKVKPSDMKVMENAYNGAMFAGVLALGMSAILLLLEATS